jgi:hypothetical protein
MFRPQSSLAVASCLAARGNARSYRFRHRNADARRSSLSSWRRAIWRRNR